MLFHWAVLLLPAAISQFLPLDLAPDMAFGDHNDRFDLTSMYKPHHKHKFRSDDKRRINSRRSNVDNLHSDQPKYRRFPLDDDWLESMAKIAEDRHADGEASVKDQDSRRHHPVEIYEVADNISPLNTDRGTLPKFAPPVNIELKDRASATFNFNVYKD